MTYFDSAATSVQKPEAVAAAVAWAMDHCASIGRSGHPWALRASEAACNCRCLAAEWFEAPSPEHVVFTMNTTHALNIAIKSLVKAGDRVVISGFEHNSVVRPLVCMDAETIVAGRDLFHDRRIVQAFDQAITDKTKAVICTHVSNVFGYVLPLQEIAAICRERGVPLVVDAAQSAGTIPVSLRELDAAFIAMPGHKGLLGPQGTGLLICGREPRPLMEGGTGSLSQILHMPDFLPDLGEVGTHNTPGIAGLYEGMSFVKANAEAIRKKEQLLTEEILKELRKLPDAEVFSGEEQTGVVSFRCSMDCEILADALGKMGIAVRAGLHCAPLAHESAGTLQTGTVRISVSFYTKEEDVERLFFGLRKIII